LILKYIKMRFSIISLALIATCFQSLFSQVLTLDSTSLTVRVLAENLDTPWEILWGPDDHIWMTERRGVVSRIDTTTGEVQVLLDISETVDEGSENGMLGMVLHPNFTDPDSQYVYIVYTYYGTAPTERLVRYTYDVDTLVDEYILLDDIPSGYYHIGSRLLILPDRTILMSTGDVGSASYAQDTSRLNGKFLRLNLDGSVPDDNPIPGSYVWSLGHRNPQGLVRAPYGTIYSSEHGPSNDDEINVITKLGNYGWPDVQGYCDLPAEEAFCTAYNVIEPLMAWTPTIATCGLDYYGHDVIPEWKHSLLLATLKEDDLRVLKLNEAGDGILSEQIFFNNEYGRLRDVCVSPGGEIFLATSNRDGRGNDGFPVVTDDRIIKVSNESQTGPTGTGAYDAPLKLRFYPNPVENTLYLDHQEVTGYRIYDLSSRLVAQGHDTHTADVSGLQKGIYILEVQVGGVILKGKFLKK
jgi:glucose/arabinose dehydrogenase